MVREEIAGGMSYRTMKGIDTSIMKYLAGRDERSSAEILEKNKNYYIASADKTTARLELAKTRIENANLPDKDEQLLSNKISFALKWLENLKNNIRIAKDDLDFFRAVSYKKWHAVKLTPSAAEGYAISVLMECNLKEMNNTLDIKKFKEAKSHIQKAKGIFSELLNLKENSDFKLAEKRRIEAYGELNLIWNLQNN